MQNVLHKNCSNFALIALLTHLSPTDSNKKYNNNCTLMTYPIIAYETLPSIYYFNLKE